MASVRVLVLSAVILASLANALQLEELLFSSLREKEGFNPENNELDPPMEGMSPLQLARQNFGLETQEKTEEQVGGSRGILDLAIEAIYNQALKPIYMPHSNNVNDECKMDVKNRNFFNNLIDGKWWALRMFDSWGKLTDGFLFGNLRSTGMYEECLDVVVNYTAYVTIITTSLRNYTGRYCQVYYGSAPDNESALAREGVPIEDPASPLPFSYGTCIPSSCTAEDMRISINETLTPLGLAVSHIECYTANDPVEDFTPADDAMLSLIGIFGILVLLSTIYDFLTDELSRTHLRKGVWEVFIGFSITKNLKKIFTYEESPQVDAITCLPALKVISLLWIIICYQYQVATDYITNTFDSLRYQDPVIGQVVTNGWLAVDTFLFISGLVITYRLLPYVVPGSGRLLHMLGVYGTNYVRRFLRLSPSILFVSLFSASLLRYFAYGPRADVLRNFSKERCEPNWWKDPLFINNYIIGENEGNEVNDCLDHCWYTAVDMQLLLILPLLLLPIAMHRTRGMIWLLLVSIGSIVTPMAIILVYDLPPIPLHFLEESVRFEYMWRVFLTPWCRAGPWLVGVWTALLLVHKARSKVKLPRIAVILGYLAAISLGFGLVLGLYPYNHVFPDKSYKDNPAMSASYGALARPVWALCIAWVVFTCHTGNAGPVNRILSYPGWRPLARLTFCMYLVVPVVQMWWSSVQFQPVYYNYLEKLFQSAGITFISGVVAILITCLVELPVCTMIDVLLPSPAKKQESLMPLPRDAKRPNSMSTSRM